MAKKKRGKKLNINSTRMIKFGAIAVFTIFAGILFYVSVFIWSTLSNIGGESDVSTSANVQGINEKVLNDIEDSLDDRRLSGPAEERPRNPFMPVGMQIPAPPEPEPESAPPEEAPATDAGGNETPQEETSQIAPDSVEPSAETPDQN